MPMRLHRGVLGQGKPPSPAPSKERPFLPRLKDGGILARFGYPILLLSSDLRGKSQGRETICTSEQF